MRVASGADTRNAGAGQLMPVGDCQRAFGVAAIRDGLPVVSNVIAGLSDAGHLALAVNSPIRNRLGLIFSLLRGDLLDLKRGPYRPLRLDWMLPDSHLIIEIDESQHFTTDRLRTLEEYPPDPGVCFDVEEYKNLCQILRIGSDRYRAAKPARGFRREGGRRSQRAYLDAVRDLGAPSLGWRVFRVAAGHGDGTRAYQSARSALRSLV